MPREEYQSPSTTKKDSTETESETDTAIATEKEQRFFDADLLLLLFIAGVTLLAAIYTLLPQIFGGRPHFCSLGPGPSVFSGRGAARAWPPSCLAAHVPSAPAGRRDALRATERRQLGLPSTSSGEEALSIWSISSSLSMCLLQTNPHQDDRLPYTVRY